MRTLALLLCASRAWAVCAGLFTGTPCTATVGAASRNYATIQDCVNAIPSNLITDGNSYVCSVYNDALFTTAVSISGKTADSTYFITVTAAPGQSFADHPTIRANPLTFDQSKGVAISINAAFTTVFLCSVPYTRISRIQVRNTSVGGGSNIAIQTSGVVTGIEIRDVIADSIGGGGSSFGIVTLNAGSKLVNALVVSRSSAAGIVTAAVGNLIIGSTIVRPASVGLGQTGIVASSGAPVVRSTAVFGFATATSGVFGSSQSNATDRASGLPGSGNVYNAPYTTATFGDTNADYRAMPGSFLQNGGYRDATNAPNDISGAPRSATPTIGAWELMAAVTSAPRHRVIQ
jgi:hypothetical protein